MHLACRCPDKDCDFLIPITDTLARPLKDLRISVMDRCNLRCTYCMPEESLNGKGVFLPSHHLLSDGEIELMVRVFTSLGVHKVRLTGGEPLLRPGFVELVDRISSIEGITDLALTTNAVLLPRYAEALKKAGLGRITVSLDSLDEAVFREMAGGRGSVSEVLDGIEAAEQAGFDNVKINTVVQRNINDHTVPDLVEHFRNSGHTIRLIEFMDVGNVNHWDRQLVVPSADLLKNIHDRWPLRPVAKQPLGETARRYAFTDGAGEIGFISSITEPFCGDCSRARITADGTFYSCLFSARGTELRDRIRGGLDAKELTAVIRDLWEKRGDRYSELRNELPRAQPHVEMYRMGG
ncbi:MAG: GTP 3',8-cyclase MoaA [Xanthomonadales bacterium]|nr:GTP 3',8-cyclase MoaA [Xanthomonadales bacterium]